VFDIGFSELLVIAIVALVVLGPERLPKAARFAGLWVRRARNQWDSVKQELERELQAEDIKRQMQDVRQSMQDTESELRASGEAARRHVQDVDAQGRTLADEIHSTEKLSETLSTAAQSVPPAMPEADAAINPDPARVTDVPAVASPARPDPNDVTGDARRPESTP